MEIRLRMEGCYVGGRSLWFLNAPSYSKVVRRKRPKWQETICLCSLNSCFFNDMADLCIWSLLSNSRPEPDPLQFNPSGENPPRNMHFMYLFMMYSGLIFLLLLNAFAAFSHSNFCLCRLHLVFFFLLSLLSYQMPWVQHLIKHPFSPVMHLLGMNFMKL